MKKPVVLRIYKGEQLLGVKQFVDPQIVIGRPGDVQVALEGDSVSIIHASIEEREPGKYFVSDLGSVSGTRKNGETVLDAPILSGDTLFVGDYKIEFYIGPPPPKAAVVPTDGPEGLKSVAFETPAKTAPLEPFVPQDESLDDKLSKASFEKPAEPVKPVEVAKPIEPLKPVEAPKPVEAARPTAVSSATTPKASSPEAPTTPPVAATPTAQTPATTTVAPTMRPTPITSKPTAPPPVAPQAPLSPAPPTAPPKKSGPSPNAAAATGGGLGLVGPKTSGARGTPIARKNGEPKSKKRKTFAPPGKYNDVKDFVKPSKGTIVEVLVAWGERIIATHHFSQAATITIGSHPTNDIVIPLANARKLPIVKIDRQAIVIISPEMRGEVIKGQTSSSFVELQRTNRLGKAGSVSTFALDQGEMARLELGENLSALIRYVSDSPKPMVAPLLDLTGTETTGVILAFALVATLKLYMFLYEPPKGLPSDLDNQPVRTAMIVLTPPTPPPLPPPPAPTPVAVQPTPVPTPMATPPPAKIKVAEKTVTPTVKKVDKPTVTNLTTKQDPGKSAAAAPNKNKTGPRIQTSVKQGGAVKTSKTEGAQMQSKNKDVSKSGIFATLGKGLNNDVAQSTTGSGELAGMAAAASGKTGSAENRAGQGLGSQLKDTGMGGNGKALQGIAGGVGTTGRGSGISGTGEGGLGNRSGTKIFPGGAGEEITGTIDREAIRRVVRQNLPAIRACYERQLNRNQDLFGKIVLSWDIGEQGRVVGARVKSNELGGAAGAEVANCILAKLKTWKFPEPPPNQVAEVAYPFLFSN